MSSMFRQSTCSFHTRAAHLAHDEGVGLAVERDVVHDVAAAADAVLDVGVQVRADLLVLRVLVQGDLGERQQVGDLLVDEEKGKEH